MKKLFVAFVGGIFPTGSDVTFVQIMYGHAHSQATLKYYPVVRATQIQETLDRRNKKGRAGCKAGQRYIRVPKSQVAALFQ